MSEEFATSNGTTLSMAQEYVGECAPEGIRAQALLRDSARVVRDIAPPPQVTNNDYRQDASDAELRVFDILVSGGRSVKSESVDSISVTYSDASSDAYALVRDTMARWIPAHSSDDGPGTVSFAEVNWYA